MRISINPERKLWSELTKRNKADNSNIEETVVRIIESVKRDGDEAIIRLAKEIDKVELESLAVSEEEFNEAESLVSVEIKEAISQAAQAIKDFHKAQKPSMVKVETRPGVTCYQKAVPIQRIGLYIPGGRAPLFSTVLMLAIPANVAGCKDIVLCSPCRPDGRIAAETLYAAKYCGIEKVYKVGGAQAIAAMALGTESITKCDKIFGPGNSYVTTAKQILSVNDVTIDMPAGPSEVMVLADESANPAYIAADMLSQAEHGPDSQSMLVCSSEKTAQLTIEELDRQTKLLSRQELVEKSLNGSKIIVFDAIDDMIDFANEYASEHLIINMENAWDIAERILNAGSIFIGKYSPESAGDYASGTNHTLPTSAWAKAYSGVNLDAFMKKITYQELTKEGLRGISQTICSMAQAEGLDAHANAVKIRLSE